MTSAVDVPEYRPGRRRRFSYAEKLAILSEAVSRGESMSALGRRSGLAVSLLFRWRKELEHALPSSPLAAEGKSDLEAASMTRRIQLLESELQWLAKQNRRLQDRVSRFEQLAAADIGSRAERPSV